MKPSTAIQRMDNCPANASSTSPSSDAARSASAPISSRRRELRSASKPAGMDSSRNGSDCAADSNPVCVAPAPSVSTATIGTAARVICSADWAARLDQARRVKAAFIRARR
jgi:hypothetical protein